MKKSTPVTKGLFVSKKSQSQLKIVVMVCGIAIALFYTYLYMQKSTLKPQSIGINEVNVDSGVIATPKECQTVKTVSYSNLCGAHKYKNVAFICGGSKKNYQLGNKTACKNMAEWYTEAVATCTASCPAPSPRPSMSPLPNTTSAPGSSITPRPITPVEPRPSGKVDLIYGTEPVVEPTN